MASPRSELSRTGDILINRDQYKRTYNIVIDVANSTKLSKIILYYKYSDANKVKVFKFYIYLHGDYTREFHSAAQSAANQIRSSVKDYTIEGSVIVQSDTLADAFKVIEFVNSYEQLDEQSLNNLYLLLAYQLQPQQILDQVLMCTNSAEALTIAKRYMNADDKLVSKDSKKYPILYLLGMHYQEKGLLEDAKTAYKYLIDDCKFEVIRKMAHYQLAKMARDVSALNDEREQVLNVFNHYLCAGSYAVADFDKPYIEKVLHILGIEELTKELGKCVDSEIGVCIAAILEELKLEKETFALYSVWAPKALSGAAEKANFRCAQMLVEHPELSTESDETARKLKIYNYYLKAGDLAKEHLAQYFENECNKLAKQAKFSDIIADLLHLTKKKSNILFELYCCKNIITA
ncbi:MAG TPA: hypothetical protein VL360_07245 [Gammaproteobacteria bacterium]|jgi:hypothetical protein|nr:hypothetical protein [Gammaproteobacteria bacterium]